MKHVFKNKMRPVDFARGDGLIGSIFYKLMYVAFISFVFFQSCSDSSPDEIAQLISIPINFAGDNSAGLTENDRLDLVTATAATVSVTGCSSSFAVSSFTLGTASTINFYNGDKNCLVKLLSFNLSGQIYNLTNAGAVAFSSYLAGGVATFAGASSSDILKVFVIAQLTQSGVLSTDTVTYQYTNIQATTTSTPTTTFGIGVSTSGVGYPAFTIAYTRASSVNANGSVNMSFTLQCGAAVTGSNPTYLCGGIQMNTELSYIFIPDAYSQSTSLTDTQLASAFTANTPTTVGSSVIGVGGTDPAAHVIANGGFFTATLVTGTTPLYQQSNINYVLMVRRTDTATSLKSYIYYYVDFSPSAASTVSACGTRFPGGAGTVGNPYQINDATSLSHVGLCTTSTTFFIQTASINLTGTTWTPTLLYGQYNGNGNAIINLTYSNATAAAVDGLFSTIQSGASVSNLTLSNFSVTSSGVNVGGLAGASAGTISNTVLTSGTITNTYAQAAAGSDFVGGLIGNMNGGSITTSGSAANVVGVSSSANTGTFDLGGLVGLSTVPSISSSYATGNVSITTASSTAKTINMGNLIGAVTSGTAAVTQNYSTGNITFPTLGTNTTLRMGSIGQFAPTSGSVSYSFAKGTYTASSALTMTIGGMVGALTSPATVNNSYTMVTFSTTGQTAGNLGGFVGTTSTTNLVSLSYSADPSFSSTITTRNVFNGSGTAVLTSYYYNGATGLPAGTTSGATAESSANMQLQGTFTNLTFGTNPTNWAMPTASTFSSPSGFLSPVLRWQCNANGISC